MKDKLELLLEQACMGLLCVLVGYVLGAFVAAWTLAHDYDCTVFEKGECTHWEKKK